MNTRQNKIQEHKAQSVAKQPEIKGNQASVFGFKENVAQQQLQEAISNSSKVRQLKGYEAVANSSPQSKHLMAYQLMADKYVANRPVDPFNSNPVQRTKVELSGKTVEGSVEEDYHKTAMEIIFNCGLSGNRQMEINAYTKYLNGFKSIIEKSVYDQKIIDLIEERLNESEGANKEVFSAHGGVSRGEEGEGEVKKTEVPDGKKVILIGPQGSTTGDLALLLIKHKDWLDGWQERLKEHIAVNTSPEIYENHGLLTEILNAEAVQKSEAVKRILRSIIGGETTYKDLGEGDQTILENFEEQNDFENYIEQQVKADILRTYMPGDTVPDLVLTALEAELRTDESDEDFAPSGKNVFVEEETVLSTLLAEAEQGAEIIINACVYDEQGKWKGIQIDRK